jgi:hypothetical protein
MGITIEAVTKEWVLEHQDQVAAIFASSFEAVAKILGEPEATDGHQEIQFFTEALKGDFFIGFDEENPTVPISVAVGVTFTDEIFSMNNFKVFAEQGAKAGDYYLAFAGVSRDHINRGAYISGIKKWMDLASEKKCPNTWARTWRTNKFVVLAITRRLGFSEVYDYDANRNPHPGFKVFKKSTAA